MIKKLYKDSIIYGIGQIINKLIAVLILPLTTKNLSVDNIGIIDLITTIQHFGLIFSLIGIDTALTFYYWDAKKNKDAQKTYITTGFSLILLISAIVFIILFFLENFFLTTYIKQDIGIVYLYAIVTIPMNAIFTFLLKLCRIKRKPIIFNIISIINLILYLALLYFFIKYKEAGIISLYYSRIFVLLIVIVLLVLVFRKDIFFKIKLSHIKRMLLYAVPLLPLMFEEWIMRTVDKLIILNYHGIYYNGIYSVALKISLAAGIVLGAFNLSWGPFAMSIKNDINAKKTYANVLLAYYTISVVIIFLIQVFSPLLIIIFSTRDYLNAVPIIGLLTFSIVLRGMFSIIAVGLNITKKTIYLSIGTTIMVITNLILNLLLIPKYKLYGAAIATFVGQLVATIFTYFIGKKYYYVKYNFRLIFIISISLLIFLFIYFVNYIYNKNILLNVLTNGLLIICFVSILAYLQKDLILTFINKYKIKREKNV